MIVDPSSDDDPLVVISVVRTGGIAGMRRRWRVEAPPEDAEPWISLVERCPWDEPPASASGADRFVWKVRCRTPAEEYRREVPDDELSGPWRALVDAVRASSPRNDAAGGDERD